MVNTPIRALIEKTCKKLPTLSNLSNAPVNTTTTRLAHIGWPHAATFGTDAQAS